MPTYEYECEKCGKVFEHSQGITEEPLRNCPAKGCKGKVHRLLSGGGGVIFKGKGFYHTDYKNEKAPACAAGCGCPNSKNCPAASGE